MNPSGPLKVIVNDTGKTLLLRSSMPSAKNAVETKLPPGARAAFMPQSDIETITITIIGKD